ncbi:MAG: hypothetical protein IIC35_00110 [Gemmatimonadetes bacterium]|nr:hypothetical protein [Gemmatimonadota bacterium]
MSDQTVSVRLLFVDEGSYHHEDIQIPASSVDAYDRLIDCVREDPLVLKRVYVDVERLCAAYVTDGE